MRTSSVIFVAIVVLGTLSVHDSHYVVCTEDARLVLNDILLISESFENDPLNPNMEKMKSLLASLHKLFNECFGIRVDLSKYQICVDTLRPLFPVLRKLIDDLNKNNSTEVISDISQIVLIVGDQIYPCIAKREFIEIYS